MSQENQKTYVNYYIKPGTFYLASKEPKDGHKEIKYGPDKDKTTYHKEVDTVKGKLTGITLSEHPTIGDQIKIFLEVGENAFNVVVFPLYNRFSDISGWGNSFARVVNNLQTNEVYTFKTNTTRTDKEGRPYEGFVIEDSSGDEVRWTIKNSDVPELKRTENAAGKVKYDGSERTDFLLRLLLQKVKRQESSSQVSTNTDSGESVPAKQEAAVSQPSTEQEKDDLPF